MQDEEIIIDNWSIWMKSNSDGTKLQYISKVTEIEGNCNNKHYERKWLKIAFVLYTRLDVQSHTQQVEETHNEGIGGIYPALSQLLMVFLLVFLFLPVNNT